MKTSFNSLTVEPFGELQKIARQQAKMLVNKSLANPSCLDDLIDKHIEEYDLGTLSATLLRDAVKREKAGKQIVQVLEAVRDLIESGWCQCIRAIDSNGNVCAPSDDKAYRWCLQGAAERVAITTKIYPIDVAYALGFTTINRMTAWNDLYKRTRLEVIGLLNVKIAHYKSEGRWQKN